MQGWQPGARHLRLLQVPPPLTSEHIVSAWRPSHGTAGTDKLCP